MIRTSKKRTPRTRQRLSRGARTLNKQLYEDPVTLTRKQFQVAWEAICFAAEYYEDDFEGNIPKYDPSEEEELVIAEAGQAMCRMKRLRYQLERYIPTELKQQ